MELDLRPVTGEEQPAFCRAAFAAFGRQPDDEELASVRDLLEPARTLAAFDDGDVVATAGAISFELTLPGGTAVPAAGVTAVTVRSTHRRRGLLRAMMARQLDDVAARGEPVAVLTASESGIYARFGYGPAASVASWRLATEGTQLVRRPDPPGRLRPVGREEAATLVPSIHDRARRRQPGALARTPGWWARWSFDRERDRAGASARFTLVHEGPGGGADGYAAYRVRPAWDHGLPASEVVVEEVDAVDDEVEAALWQHLLDLDLVRTVTAAGRPVHEPLRWRLADPRRLVTTEVTDHLWVRLVDVPAALAARRYGTADALVVELAHGFRPGNDGRYLVEGGPDGAACTRTTRPADLVLTAPELASLYLGGVPATVLARAGRVDERAPGALRRADAFFASSPPPWCGTRF